jgi:hypothetical protein
MRINLVNTAAAPRELRRVTQIFPTHDRADPRDASGVSRRFGPAMTQRNASPEYARPGRVLEQNVPFLPLIRRACILKKGR